MGKINDVPKNWSRMTKFDYLRNRQICKNKLESFPDDLVALDSCTLHPDGSISDNVDTKCKHQFIMQRGEANILTRLFDAVRSGDLDIFPQCLMFLCTEGCR